MDKEIININVNFLKEPIISTFIREDKEIKVANFTFTKGYGKEKEYINCAVYREKVKVDKEFLKDDFTHVYDYFNNRTKNGKTYKNFVVKSYNKIEKKEENEEE